MAGQADGPPPEDMQTMVKLYQKCPQRWKEFRDIVHVVDLMTTKCEPDHEVAEGLSRTGSHLEANHPFEVDVLTFATACGFIEKGVTFSRQILRDMGKTYLTEFPDINESDVSFVCLYQIRNQILNCTADSPEFCLRLTKTGYLEDLVEDIKHIQHLSAEALESSGVFLIAMGTFHNCCMFPDSAAAVRQLGIGPHVIPFLTKRGRTPIVRAIATAVASNVVGEDQLDVLALDGELLQYFLDTIQGALSTNKHFFAEWYMCEILFDLGILARVDFNSRLMVAQGILHILQCVLDPSRERSEDEKNKAVALLSRLTEDPVNLHICQNYQELMEVLQALEVNCTGDITEKVCDVLEKLKCRKTAVEERIPAFPHVAQLLAGQYNLLSILHMGLAEFVLDEVTHVTGDQGQAAARGQQEASCHQGLRALTELTEDSVYRREITARGGLSLLKTVLQTGSREQKTEAARAVLGLARAPENMPVIRLNTDLTSLLEDAKQRTDNPDLAQLADSILQGLQL